MYEKDKGCVTFSLSLSYHKHERKQGPSHFNSMHYQTDVNEALRTYL